MPKKVSAEVLSRVFLQVKGCLVEFERRVVNLQSVDGFNAEFADVFKVAVNDHICYLINDVMGLPGNTSKLDVFILNDLMKNSPLFSAHYATMSK